jgi:hypothetical protein
MPYDRRPELAHSRPSCAMPMAPTATAITLGAAFWLAARDRACPWPPVAAGLSFDPGACSMALNLLTMASKKPAIGRSGHRELPLSGRQQFGNSSLNSSRSVKVNSALSPSFM